MVNLVRDAYIIGFLYGSENRGKQNGKEVYWRDMEKV